MSGFVRSAAVKKLRSGAREEGFTIVEMVVATAFFLTIIVLVGLIVFVFFNQITFASSTYASQNNAQAIANALRIYLSSAQPCPGQTTPLINYPSLITPGSTSPLQFSAVVPGVAPSTTSASGAFSPSVGVVTFSVDSLGVLTVSAGPCPGSGGSNLRLLDARNVKSLQLAYVLNSRGSAPPPTVATPSPSQLSSVIGVQLTLTTFQSGGTGVLYTTTVYFLNYWCAAGASPTSTGTTTTLGSGSTTSLPPGGCI